LAATGVLALAQSCAITGRVLDVGCGTGDHVLASTEVTLTEPGE
jgi:ubiquinone/menaquinone biosynthesis C-methylase UbiE